MYQAGTLSGNPLAMAAGLAQLRELERINGWNQLEDLGAQLEQAMRESLGKTRAAAVFHRIGSMFCLFFTGEPVIDLASAKRVRCANSPPFSIIVWRTVFTSRPRSSRPASSRPRTRRCKSRERPEFSVTPCRRLTVSLPPVSDL